MINIWCVCVGDKYSHSRVDALLYMVGKNLHEAFAFNVLTVSDLPGWWAKLDLFRHEGPCLYFDLDTVIVNDLSPLVDIARTSGISATRNWAMSGHGGFQSSVLCWSKAREDIRNGFDASRIGKPDGPAHCRNHGWYTEPDGTRHWGDQEYLTHHYNDEIKPIPEGLVVSYKYHCQQGLPEKAIAVCFHGKPDYWEVQKPWIQAALS